MKNNDELLDMIFNQPPPEKEEGEENYAQGGAMTSGPGWYSTTNVTYAPSIEFGVPVYTTTAAPQGHIYLHNAADIAQAFTKFSTATSHAAQSLHALRPETYFTLANANVTLSTDTATNTAAIQLSMENGNQEKGKK